MPEASEMPSAAILVGGLGTRLRSVLADGQKVIAPVAGRPFLFRLLEQLDAAGFRHVVLCAGYRAQQVRSAVGTALGKLRIEVSVEPEPLGTGGALRHALPALEMDPVLVMNGDSYCETDLAAFVRAHLERKAAASMVVREAKDTSQSGRVAFRPSGEVTGFVEKGHEGGRGWINAGIYLLGREVLRSIPEGRQVSLEREIFPSWVGNGLWAFPSTGKFLDIGTPESYSAAQYFFP